MIDEDAPGAATPPAEIARAREAFAAALRGADAAAAASHYTDDARLLAPSAGVLTGRIAIARFWQAGIDAGVDGIELESKNLELEPGGGIAYEIGRYVLRLLLPAGDHLIDRGGYLIVHRREPDGAWRRAAEAFHPDLARTVKP